MKAHFVVGFGMRVVLTEDLMWSDPDDVDAWAVSPRGAGWLFGGKVTAEVGSPFLSPRTGKWSIFTDRADPSVQPREFSIADRSRTSTGPRRLQAHV
jgi:hypothetical protein